MEEVLLLRRRRVHLRGLGAPARALHLGEVHREHRQDPARDQGGTPAGRRVAPHQADHR